MALFLSLTAASFAQEQRILSLEDCIQKGMANSLPLKIAVERIRLDEMNLGVSIRNLFPQIKFHYEGASGSVPAGDWIRKKYSVQGRQPVFHGGELFYSGQRDKEILAADAINRLVVEQEIVFNVTEKYYRLLTAQDVEHQAKTDKKDMEDYFAKIKQGFDKGVMANVDLVGTAFYLKQMRQQYLKYERETQEAEYELKNAMAMDPHEDIEIVPLPRVLDITLPPLADCLQRAFDKRPEMMALAHELNAKEYQVKVSRAKDLPSIDMVGNLGRGGEFFKGSDPQNNSDWSLGVEVNWIIGGNTVSYKFNQDTSTPKINTFDATKEKQHVAEIGVLDNLKVYGEQQQAKIEEMEKRNDIDATMRKIYKETLNAYYQVYAQNKDAALSLAQVAYKKQLHDIARFRYQYQEVGAADVMEKKTEWALARTQYSQALGDLAVAAVLLNKAVGESDFIK